MPGAVLSESNRGGSHNAAIHYARGRGIRPVTMAQAMARAAGTLRAPDGLDSCHTVDAFVVTASVRLGGGIIVTVDPNDLRTLTRDHPNVRS